MNRQRKQQLHAHQGSNSIGAEASSKSESLNPKTIELEFFGIPGVVLVMFGMSSTIFFLYHSCNEKVGCSLPASAASLNLLLTRLLDFSNAFDFKACLVYACWYAFQALLYLYLPGEIVNGTVLRNGDVLKYKINGFRAITVTLISMYLAYSVFGFTPFIYVADHYLQLATASYIFSTMQSVFLYVYSFRKSTDPSSPETMLALGGNSGSPLYDFFMGRELNPRVGSIFDLKYFCELRPGLIGWVVLNMCLAVKQYVTFGYITNSMVIVLLTQNFYVLESLWNESKVLTTMDITTDGFGWMLSVGDLSWVPFTYTLQARYLSFTPVDLSFFYATCVFLLSITGYLVFRLSNTQKNAFRTNPNNPKLKHLRYIETRAKTKLLVSGWWGLARHINYTGDWLLGLSQCLATGFSTPITYFFSIYFLILLVHRFYRDEHKCKVKYGDDWVKYCSLVPYKFIPYIY